MLPHLDLPEENTYIECMRYPDSLKQQAIQLRRQGYSYAEIAAHLHVPRSSLHYWTSTVILDPQARERISQRHQFGIEQAKLFFQRRRQAQDRAIISSITPLLHQVSYTKNIAQIYCSLLFWAEGAKNLSTLKFANSDPLMIQFFLNAFRYGFNIDEKKLRVNLHLHEYHNETAMIQFWSTVTQIPSCQFFRTYYKPHTKIRIHPHYLGLCTINYYDTLIARTLSHCYQELARHIPHIAKSSGTIHVHHRAVVQR